MLAAREDLEKTFQLKILIEPIILDNIRRRASTRGIKNTELKQRTLNTRIYVEPAGIPRTWLSPRTWWGSKAGALGAEVA